MEARCARMLLDSLARPFGRYTAQPALSQLASLQGVMHA